MYRLTMSGPVTEQFLTKHSNPIWIRMYRWANKWGEYNPANDEWTCEKRRELAYKKEQENQAVLESVENIDSFGPPFDIDDMWEEEVVKHNNITCGNLLVITGTNAEIQESCKNISPIFLEWVVEQLGPVQFSRPNIVNVSPQIYKPRVVQTHPPYKKQFNQRRSVCLIENY